MVQQFFEQCISDLRVAIDLLQCEAQDERVGRSGGAHVEEDQRSLFSNLGGVIAVPVHGADDERKRHRGTAGDSGPAVDQERLGSRVVCEVEDSSDVILVGKDQGLLVLLADTVGADDIVADDAMNLAETSRVDRSPIRLADGDEVPEVGFVLRPRWEIGLGADGEVALEAVDDHEQGAAMEPADDLPRSLGRRTLREFRVMST